MKIILAHNYYGSAAPSGENIVFEAEAQLLRRQGHEVLEFTRHSDEIRGQGIWGEIKGGLSTPWNVFSQAATARLIKRTAPEIFHVHNSFPLLSPAVFYAAGKSAVARILTLHNFRTYCAAGIPMRAERLCTECLDQHSVRPALHHRCYRDNLMATVPMVCMIWLHRALKTWERQVDGFIALTTFQRDFLVDAGLPRDRVFVKPHFYPDPPAPLAWADREKKVLFIGRLRVEKGCHILLEAWRRWGPEAPALEIIGDGPEKVNLEDFAAQAGLSEKVSFKGQLPFEKVQAALAKGQLIVFPSLCFEGFPMVILEAFALGVPVIASRLGSMPCMIDPGLTGDLFESGEPEDLLERVKSAWASRERLATWSAAARQEFEQKYTAEANYPIFRQIYENAIDHRNKKFPLHLVD